MFTETYIQFFQDLANNNVREWFHANKKTYETAVKKPFYKFVEQLIEEIRLVNPDILITPKDAIFRINRDIRFSKDKSPYKLNMSAAISKYGKKGNTCPGLYNDTGAEYVYVTRGAY